MKFFFVGETKAIAGRDARVEGDALGRPIALVWFEQIDEDADGPIVQRVNCSKAEMELMLSSPAEVLRAAGCFPTASDSATAREVEIELEAKYMDHSLTIFNHRRSSSDHFDDPFTFHLNNPTDAEASLWASVAMEDLTKMGLARRLEVTHGENRASAWRNLSKLALLLALDPTYVPPPPAKGKGKVVGKAVGLPPPPPFAGAAKGKGKGGKGKGKGNGGKAPAKGAGPGRGLFF